ncbi:MAG TPA: alpha/beta fold hydrolase, partial [Burkholderiaceae bacterium]
LSAAASFLIALGIGVFVRAAITAHNFLLAHRYGPEMDQYPLGAAGWFRLFRQEFAATMYSSSWSMLLHRRLEHRFDDSAALPVLLVHGWGCNGGYWRGMSKAMSDARISHRAINLEPVLCAIDDYVPQLAKAVQDWAADTGSERIVIVAHSMGGLVSRAYLAQAGDSKVAHCITIGSPHHGTGLANHGIGLNCKQMRWQPGLGPSEWLTALAARDTATRAGITSICSRHDNIVSPPSSSVLEGAQVVVFDAIGHVALALDARVQQRVIAAVQAVPLQDYTRLSETAATN